MIDYSNIPDCFYRISIKALVLDEEGRFLLLREADGRWSFPGGGYEHSDTNPREALSRELQEEMGVEISEAEEHPSYFIIAENTERLAQKNSFYQANVFYKTRLKSLDFVLNDECQEIGFFTPEEALKLKAFPNIAEFCKHYKI